MKLAVLGSRSVGEIDIGEYIPENVSEIVSGGAKGVDFLAKEYALQNNIKYTEFLPEYDKYRRNAPLKRNVRIIEYADLVLILWDGKSRGTEFVIDFCRKSKKQHYLHLTI